MRAVVLVGAALLLLARQAAEGFVLSRGGRHISTTSSGHYHAVTTPSSVAKGVARRWPKPRAPTMTAVQTSLSFESGAALLPHPAKALTGGEDAYFVLPRDLGVFDGVGGWSVVPEANAGQYSRTFANLTAQSIAAQREAGVQQVDLVSALQHALKETKVIGSTTVCVASLVPQAGAMVGLNVGDSGLMLLRKSSKGSNSERPYEVAFRTRMLVHDYNTPFQLGTNCSDRPEDGQVFSCRVGPGDVVVLATDGVLDNLYEQDVVDLVGMNAKESASVLAQTLAQAAFTYAADAKRLSPWQVARGAVLFASKDRGNAGLHRFVKQRKRVEQLAMFGLDESGKPIRPLGGKVDDISVVVARIE